jgi:hypothetical protein
MRKKENLYSSEFPTPLTFVRLLVVWRVLFINPDNFTFFPLQSASAASQEVGADVISRCGPVFLTILDYRMPDIASCPCIVPVVGRLLLDGGSECKATDPLEQCLGAVMGPNPSVAHIERV